MPHCPDDSVGTRGLLRSPDGSSASGVAICRILFRRIGIDFDAQMLISGEAAKGASLLTPHIPILFVRIDAYPEAIELENFRVLWDTSYMLCWNTWIRCYSDVFKPVHTAIHMPYKSGKCSSVDKYCCNGKIII